MLVTGGLTYCPGGAEDPVTSFVGPVLQNSRGHSEDREQKGIAFRLCLVLVELLFLIAEASWVGVLVPGSSIFLELRDSVVMLTRLNKEGPDSSFLEPIEKDLTGGRAFGRPAENRVLGLLCIFLNDAAEER